MGNCALCNKKLGIFEGYDDFGKEYCGDCFHNKSKTNVKINNSHKNEEFWECRKCEKRFNKKENLIQHEKICGTKQELKGVGGWLLVWTILYSLSTLLIFFIWWLSPDGAGLFLPRGTLFIFIAVYVWAMYYLIIGSKKFSKLAIDVVSATILFNILVSGGLLETVILAFRGNYNPGVNVWDYVGSITGQILGIGIQALWIFYFKKSKRVKNTFTN
ncbi:MAG: DUF2569 domain-containing protein [Novosphingobium sp.]|nr:DUF2569 domain-containing protein [Novosphingobium sp.]